MSKDYYAILGVPKTAKADEIKKAFRRLAHEHHPDKGGNEQRFKDVNEAYQVLGDEKKRAAFDRFGSAAFEQGAPGGQGGFGGFDFSGFQGGFGGGGFQVNMDDLGDLGDVLGEMFGLGRASGGRGRSKPRGQDIQVDTELSFRESVFGVEKNITLVKPATCSSCKGDGAETGAKRVSCTTCQGSGQVRQAQRTMFGVMQVAATCSACHGTGQVPERACKTCAGTGIHRQETTVSAALPAGLSNADVVKMPGQGEAAPHGGTPGDLYLRIHVKSDPHLTREGSDILSEVDVPYSVLMLGGMATVETIDGPVEVSIQDRTPTGTKISLRGHGVPSGRRQERGQHIATVRAAAPKKITKEQEAALKTLREAGL